MKKGWSQVALGEVLEGVSRFEAPQPGVQYRQLGVRLWGEGAYERQPVNGGDTQYTIFNRCETGDLVVNKIWARNGSVSVVQPELSGCFVSTEFPVYRSKSAAIPGWLRLITKAPWFWTACDEQARGTSGKNRIKPSAFLDIEIPLPPLEEQQRVVAHLEAVESRLTRIRQLREEQDRELKAVLGSAFNRLGAHAESKPMSDIAPLAWRQITIDPDASYTEYGVRSFFKGIFFRRKVLGSEFTWQKLFRLHTGDIVFSNIMAWEQAIAVAGPEQDGWVGNHRMLVCEPRRDMILPICLHHYFMTTDGFNKVLQASPGTAARNKTLKAENLMAIQVPVPLMPQQRAFEALCRQIQGIRTNQTPQVVEQNALLPSLLDHIFHP